MPKLSFIIPAYNAEQTLEKCVKSITNQPLKDTEIIIVDDGSTDRTCALAQDLARSDKRIHVIHKNNSGVSAARNIGIDNATGDYIFFCDSDDSIEPKVLPEAIKRIDQSNAEIIIFDHIRGRDRSSKRIHLFPQDFDTTNAESIHVLQCLLLCIQPSRIPTPEFSHCNGLGGAAWHHVFKRSLIEENHLRFDSDLDGLLEDGLFVMNALEKANHVAYCGIPFYRYSPGEQSATHGYHPDFDVRCHKAYEKFFSFGKEHHKGEQYFQSLYARLLYFIKGLFDVDFFCDQNPFPKSDRYYAFVHTITNEPFSSGLKRLNTRQFLSKKERLQAHLLKAGFLKLFWNFRNAKQRTKKILSKLKTK